MRNQLWLLLLPPILYGISAYTYPFSHVISEKKIAVSNLTVQQKLNIHKAATRLDGLVVHPGQEFSFNRVVGPRTEHSGYYSAPSYVGANTYSSPGGGICVVSSALYQDALRAGLKVSQRVAHQRTMQTVEPGLDATVWYGGADLKFINDTKAAIRVECGLNDGYLKTALTSDREAENPTKLTTKEFIGANNEVAVEVLQEYKDHSTKIITRDLYATNSHTNKSSPRLSWTPTPPIMR